MSLPARFTRFVPALGGVLAAALAAALFLTACRDSPTAPSGAGETRMGQLWPNTDRLEWRFSVVKRSLASGELLLTPINEPVAEVTLADARRMLAEVVPPGAEPTETYTYAMQFQGDVDTRSGVHAQNLYEWFPPTVMPGPARRGSGIALGAPGTFLSRLASARPDLRARLAAMAPDAPPLREPDARAAYDPWPPYLIHGYAWLKADSYIGAYGDADTLLAWKFLESNIRPGHEFKFQLLPLISDDLFLSASVERELDLTVPGVGRVRHALEVLYLIDYGDAPLTDHYGNPYAHFRTFDYGKVTYAPGIGPVSVVERRFAWVGGEGTLGTWELDFTLLAPPAISARAELAAGSTMPGIGFAATRRSSP